MKQISLLTIALLATSSAALARLPPLSNEAKAKAAEAAAKTAWQGNVGAYQLCQVQSRIASSYRSGMKAVGADASGSASAPAAASAAPVAAPVETPACTDPGAFAYTPESGGAAPPLEASEAHSPAKTATGPPSSVQPDAEKKPAPK